MFSSEKMEYTLFVSLLFFFVATPFRTFSRSRLSFLFPLFFLFFFVLLVARNKKKDEKRRKKGEEKELKSNTKPKQQVRTVVSKIQRFQV